MQETDLSNGVNDNHSVVLKILCKQKSGLKVVHFNARSLNGQKFDHVKPVFENSDIDIIWYKNHYNIKGYNLYYNSRPIRKGGGVAIYCKSNLKSKLVNTSNNSDV